MYHLTLLLTVEEIVIVLHGHKLVPAMLLSNILQRLELPGRHGRGTDVANPALLYDIVESLHNLLPRGVAVQTMDLEDVDVCAKSLHALLYRVEDVLAAETDLVDGLTVVGR
jgi:hypothetical protein